MYLLAVYTCRQKINAHVCVCACLKHSPHAANTHTHRPQYVKRFSKRQTFFFCSFRFLSAENWWEPDYVCASTAIVLRCAGVCSLNVQICRKIYFRHSSSAIIFAPWVWQRRCEHFEPDCCEFWLLKLIYSYYYVLKVSIFMWCAANAIDVWVCVCFVGYDRI